MKLLPWNVALCYEGIGPQHAMQLAERLYTQGYISYPRTETTSYPENFDLRYLSPSLLFRRAKVWQS